MEMKTVAIAGGLGVVLGILLKNRPAIRNVIENSLPVRILAGHPLGRRVLKDAVFRARLSLYPGLLISLLYGAVQLAAGVVCQSIWLGALAVYHILLAAIHFLLLRSAAKRTARTRELRHCRLCGAGLLLMTPVFASILVLVIQGNHHAGYPGALIYPVAVYAFCKVKLAISNTRKFRTCGSPILYAAKEISLISALLSLLTLETAVLSRYGNTQSPAFYRGLLGTIGGAVCLFTLYRAVAMMVRAKRERQADGKEMPAAQNREEEHGFLPGPGGNGGRI